MSFILKTLAVALLYPKLFMLAVTLFLSAGSARPGNAGVGITHDAMAMAPALALPFAALLLFSPLLFALGITRFRKGETVSGLVMMAVFLVPGLAVGIDWR